MEKKKLTPKLIVLRILFAITFIPYLIVIGTGVDGLINGFSFMGSYYEPGWDSAISSATIVGIILCYFPIIPVCIIIQICVLIAHILKKHNKKFSIKIFSIVAASLIGIGLVIWGLNYFSGEI